MYMLARPRLDLFSEKFDKVFDYGHFTKDENNYITELDVPGFSGGDLDVEFSKGVILVGGKKGKRSVSYCLSVPEYSDVNRASAEAKDGVLRVTLPILEEAKVKRIEVKS